MSETNVKERQIDHEVIIWRGSKIWVCSHHCCDIDGVIAVK